MAEALTGVGATGATGTVAPNISIALTGVSAAVTQGFMTESVGPGESFTLLAPTLQFQLTGVSGGKGSFAFDTLLPQLAMTGTVPVPGIVTLTVPRPGLEMTGVAGAVGTLVLRTPKLAISFGDEGGMRFEVPLPTLTMTGGSGAVGALTLRPPLPTLALTGQTETIGTLTLRHRLPRLTMEMASGRVGTISRTLPLPTLVMSGAVGTNGTINLAAPLPALQLTGHFAATGILAISTPAIRLVMSGITQGTSAQVAATRTTYALQTERLALTKYTNFAFNSFAVFNGRYFGASEEGIFELTGDDDAGTDIQAAARFGVTDMNTSRVKRVDRVYIGYSTDVGGAILLRVLTNGTQQRDYAVPPARTGELHGAHATLGKGVEARYWQFEVRNRDGAALELDTVEVKPTPMRRRQGAKDA